MSVHQSVPSNRGLGQPAQGGITVVTSDTVGYTNSISGANQMARALYVGVAGDVTVLAADGSVVLFTAVPIGGIIPILHSRVNDTGTTATNMTALY